jgi:hypothetical protein
LTSQPHWSVTLILFPHLFPFPRRVRRMGLPHRPAGPDAEPMRVRARLGKPPRGKDPFALRNHSNRGFAGHRSAATSPLRPRVQSPCVTASLPLCRLDRAPTLWTRAPLLSYHHLLWGFPHSPVPLLIGEKGERRRGASSPAPHQGDQSAIIVQEARVVEGPLWDEEVKREEQSRDATAVHHYTVPPVFPEPDTTTPPTQCERHRSHLSFSSSLVSTLC